ncbi:alpha/beta fold hydrolase [Rhodopila globiformis]|uniref:Alpha/beta hydrolase n=1 Tax=Rhodopila globiformis TaxID=1071 RepID=A0A2S6NP46_RHOGL|nr:alpha/beta hydrolase [Rhodopila globiformis]PPQ39789.1 alpha/beta hydrolase [Rhodopila globiformis]
MRSFTVQVTGGALEAAWWGPGPAEAPTLVLLHEGLGCVALWRDVPERLAAATGWGVFAYSRSGYGRSTPATLPRPLTYMHHEAQVVLPEVLEAAGIRRCALVGHSDGGSIAAIYAGSAGSAAPPAPSSPAILGLVTIAAHFFVEDINIASIERIKVEYETGPLRAKLARYHDDVDGAFYGWNGAWLDPDFRRFDITGFLPGIQVPILGLQGADDPYGTDEQLHVLKANVRAPVEIALIPGAKHSPHLEARDGTLAAITGFIAAIQRDFSS